MTPRTLSAWRLDDCGWEEPNVHGFLTDCSAKRLSARLCGHSTLGFLDILHDRADLAHLDLLIPGLLQHALSLLVLHARVPLVVDQCLHVALLVETVLRELVLAE